MEIRSARRQSGVVVLVDPKLVGYKDFVEKFEPVIRHWKFPFFFCGIDNPHIDRILPNSNLILIFQPLLGRNLPSSIFQKIDKALRKGIGLFVADPSFLSNPALRNFGFSKALPRLRGSMLSKEMRLSVRTHFITETKRSREVMIPSLPFRCFKVEKKGATANPLLHSGGQPLLFTSQHQKAKLGFLMFDPGSFMDRQGFGGPFDVFYWRSIVFLAKKPFVQLVPPPFVTFRIEDVIGEGRYEYLEILLRNHFKAHLGLDLDDFDRAKASWLVKFARQRRIEFSPHAWSHYKKVSVEKSKLIYGQMSGKEYPLKQIKGNMEKLQEFSSATGIRFSPVLTYHYCQVGKNALPFLKKMGVKYLAFPFQTNRRLDSILKSDWRREPFDSLRFVCDKLPEDESFFVITSLMFPKGDFIKKKQMDVSITSQLDFLFGLRLKAPGKVFSQYQEVERRIGEYSKLARETLFFTCLFTHETLINYLRPFEFEKVVAGISKTLKPLGVRHELYQNICEYYRRRAETEISLVKRADQKIICSLMGPRNSRVDMTVYRDDGQEVKSRSKQVYLNQGMFKTIL